jgi:hypothetical protein
VSDHHHYEYAEARHDHRGDYAEARHDHDIDYADLHHRHYSLEHEDETLRTLVKQWESTLRELREDLQAALERIRSLEDRQPDYSDPGLDDFTADRHVDLDAGEFGGAMTDADYNDRTAVMPAPEPGSYAGRAPFDGVPRLRRLRRSPADEPFGDLDCEDGDYDDCEPTL